MLIDAHAHYHRPDELPARRGVRTLFCGTNPETAAQVLALRGNGRLVSCGLHPWQADRFTVTEMLPYIKQSAALGEIGLDSVWTDVDMDIQREAFAGQLALAVELNRPVVLHTKGMEAEVARMLGGCPVRKLVHWYSCGEHLERYIDQDCYFTVGPDWAVNPHVRRVVQAVPLNRLLTETDGFGAIGWALGREATPADIIPALEGELCAIAGAHGATPEEAAEIVRENLMAFVYGPCQQT